MLLASHSKAGVPNAISMINKNNICVIGGAGHVGAPLGLVLGSKGYKVVLIDKNEKNIKKINKGLMPFL